MKPEVDLGAWIVAVYKVVSQYNVDDPALDPLEAIVTAGRAADLFSATRSLGKSMLPNSTHIVSLPDSSHCRPRRFSTKRNKLGFVDLVGALIIRK